MQIEMENTIGTPATILNPEHKIIETNFQHALLSSATRVTVIRR